MSGNSARRTSICSLLILLAVLLLVPSTAGAHVKWFSKFSFSDQPLALNEVLSPNFYLMLALALVVILVLTVLEERIISIKWVSAIDNWFASRSQHVLYVMRIGVGVTLVWCWQSENVLAPELKTSAGWVIWLELLVAFLLVFRATIKLAGVGILILYGIAVFLFGFFHMLDYLLFVGVGWFFIAFGSKNEKIDITALPALYATLGFCLIWLGIEKLVYPSWTKLLLQEHPVLTLGVPHDTFVTAAALIEISLGFMILVCLQERLLALTITLVFVLTTLVFGKEEVVGHTMIHTVLIVFLFAGPGKATPPLHWIHNVKLRMTATAFAFVLLLATLVIPYSYGSSLLYSSNSKQAPHDMQNMLLEVQSPEEAPRLVISLHKDPVAGWNLELITENFEFAPASAGMKPVEGEGHAHLMIDGEKVARLYGRWYHIPNLPVGKHDILVTLNANSHAGLSVGGKPIEAEAALEVLGDR